MNMDFVTEQCVRDREFVASRHTVFTVGDPMEEDILSDVVPSNIVSRQVSTSGNAARAEDSRVVAQSRRRRRERVR
jgi:hypothetical protein